MVKLPATPAAPNNAAPKEAAHKPPNAKIDGRTKACKEFLEKSTNNRYLN
jgi:hypothetical protein